MYGTQSSFLNLYEAHFAHQAHNKGDKALGKCEDCTPGSSSKQFCTEYLRTYSNFKGLVFSLSL